MAAPVVAIVGETAAGKTALALHLATRFNGEIIAADSRTVYRGMDIGTAKPSAAERALVPHHVLDVVAPDEPFTAADFQRLAQAAIADISGRGKLPLLVGGTGLYIDAVLYNFQFRPIGEPAERQRLRALTVDELQAEVMAAGLALPNNPRNPRHLVRLLETAGRPAVRTELRPDTLVIGLQPERTWLDERIAQRTDAMLAAGFIDEATALLARYGEVPALQAPGYRAVAQYLAGEIKRAEIRDVFIRNDRQLAKRQRTWFRRNKSIHWFRPQSEMPKVDELITTFLDTK